MAAQFLLEGRSLDELAREATEIYGDGARIVRAERVLDPGLAGFLGRRHLEVTVEVPDGRPPRVVPIQPALHVLGDRSGILALLDSADRAEDDVNADGPGPAEAFARRAAGAGYAPAGQDERGDAPGPVQGNAAEPVSTQSPGLAELLARIEQAADPTPSAAGEPGPGTPTHPQQRLPVPVPLSAPGDLVLVVGLEDTALRVAGAMLEVAGSGPPRHAGGALHPEAGTDAPRYELHGVGTVRLPGRAPLEGRWDAARARAAGVEAGSTVLVAAGLGSTAAGLPHLEAAAALGADQVWVVVDARHKAEDTDAWVNHVRACLPVDALAVLGSGESRSAHTVNGLGLPVGWLDGSPAPRTVL